MMIDCGGKFEGMQIQLTEQMIARATYDEPSHTARVILKENQSVQLFLNGRLAGFTACGETLVIKGKLAF